jgi:hypothetical protein
MQGKVPGGHSRRRRGRQAICDFGSQRMGVGSRKRRSPIRLPIAEARLPSPHQNFSVKAPSAAGLAEGAPACTATSTA